MSADEKPSLLSMKDTKFSGEPGQLNWILLSLNNSDSAGLYVVVSLVSDTWLTTINLPPLTLACSTPAMFETIGDSTKNQNPESGIRNPETETETETETKYGIKN